MPLTNDHINFIIKDLHYRGVVYEGVENELIDHICAGVEMQMDRGKKFLEAYHDVLKDFGNTSGLRLIQKQTIKSDHQNVKIMFRNYITIAFRNLAKHSFFSLINVLGLSIGISVCLIIVLFIVNEFSYDRHHQNFERIYRVASEIKFGGQHWNMVWAPAPMARALPEEFPEVEAAVHFRTRGSYLVKKETENIKENRVIWASKDVYKVFTIPFLAGNPDKALEEPHTMAISKTAADKFFPQGGALGQTLILDNEYNFKITGVYEDMPANSHFHWDYMLSMAGLEEAKSENWLSNNFQTYFLLREGASIKDLETKFNDLILKYIGPQAAQILGGEFTMERFEESGNMIKYSTQPLADIHLYNTLNGDFEPGGDITYIYLFGAVALFILVIACINFMNLSTARSANRAKEVGVRKVMGSLRSHLVRQFLTESTLLSVFSFVLAVGLAYVMLPLFNDLSNRTIALPVGQPLFYGALISGALLTGLIAGVYPSFFLSAFKPVNVLKGNVSLGMKSGSIRSALVVFQFVISIFLIIGTIAVFRQLNYIQHKKLGFNKDQVITIEDAYALGDQRIAFKKEILQNSAIVSGTITGFLPVDSWRSDNSWWPEGKSPTEDNMRNLQNWGVDYDYIKTMGMNIIEGRDFSEAFPSDSSAVILNEAAVKIFGFEGDPIGKRIVTFAGNNVDDMSPENLEVVTVIGVVENFHFSSMKDNISQLMLYINKRPQGMISFRFAAPDTKEVISLIESKWKEMAPGQPFSYTFMDDSFAKMYSSETRLGKIFGIFAGLAIFIACLGLFALTAFTAEQRTKEIGIRKVLGASVSSIVMLLSKEFGKLIVIAFVLATPFAWWAVQKWMEDYQYKVEVGWTVYALAGAGAFLVAWLTMGFQSIKAATSNPVKSLRSE
ncbi:MAG: ABC transporter permease [Cyclobacteriaceae bacterium]